jgi:hypothetical protein
MVAVMLPPEIQDIIVSFAGLETAIECGNDFVVKQLFDRNLHGINWAASTGNVRILKWVYLNYPFKIDTALIHGHLEIARWLFSEFNQYPQPLNFFIFSSEIEKWLNEIGVPRIDPMASILNEPL